MSILSTNKKLINIGKDYSAGSGIDITNDVISVIGNTVPYSAGENIDIQDFVISGKDWSNDITDASANAFNETTAWVHDNYTNSADVSFLSAEVDKKLDSSAWEAVSGSLATEDYVILSDNLTYARATAFATAQGYAKESACNSAFDYLNQNKLDVSAFDLPNSGHWNEATNVVETNSAAWFDNVGDAEVNSFVYDNSATINEVNTTYQQNSAKYITAHQSLDGYATTAEVDTLSSMLSGAIDYVSANAGGGGGGSYVSPSGSIWISSNNIESTDSAYIPSHPEDVLLTATTSWSSMIGYATLANTNKVYFTSQAERASAFDNEGTYLNSSYNTTALAETNYPPIKLYTNSWVSVKFSAYSAGIMDAYVVELARKNEVNSALNKKLDSSAFTGYYPSNNPSGFAKATDAVMTSSFNLFDGRIAGINNQYFIGCDSAYNCTLVGTSAATARLTASAYVGTGHQGVNIQISARNNGTLYINWTAFGENGSDLSAGQLYMSMIGTNPNKLSAIEFNSPLAENISGVKLYGNNYINTTAYSAYTIDVKPLASQDNITFLSGAVDYVSANAGGEFPISADESIQYVQTNSGTIDDTVTSFQTNSSTYMVESACEYNAVNEISAYNGSAIAQYGAEKQWLQHDDTIVHVANSAQYAFGVNLSALQRLMGIDRTLLWSGSKGSVSDVMDLTEPVSSFNKIEFIMNEGNTAIPLHSFISNTEGTILYPYFIRTNSNNAELCNLWSLNRQNNDTRLSVAIAVLRTNGTTSGNNATKFNEIWGIGRKA